MWCRKNIFFLDTTPTLNPQGRYSVSMMKVIPQRRVKLSSFEYFGASLLKETTCRSGRLKEGASGESEGR